MQNDFGTIIKETIINYVKCHNENSGKVMEIFNHINEAANVYNSLPANVKNELEMSVFLALSASGFKFPPNS